jgi:hypothetical protein
MPFFLPIRADAALRTAHGLVRPACAMRGDSFICVAQEDMNFLALTVTS